MDKLQWISVKDKLPPLPDKTTERYMVCVKSKRTEGEYRIWYAKWQRKLHRPLEMNEWPQEVLKESTKCVWIISGYKRSDIVYWLPIPELPIPPEEEEIKCMEMDRG